MITPRQFINSLIEDWNNSSSADPKNDDDDVGEPVTVVQNGQAFNGLVSKKDPRDPKGRVQVSFKGPRPPKDQFEPSELRRDDPKKTKTTTPATNRVPPVSTRSGDRGVGSFL
jgi:hypothetical protein